MEPGKITKYTNSSRGRNSFRAVVKRLTRRKMRRMGKVLDDTPRIVTKGWAD